MVVFLSTFTTLLPAGAITTTPISTSKGTGRPGPATGQRREQVEKQELASKKENERAADDEDAKVSCMM